MGEGNQPGLLCTVWSTHKPRTPQSLVQEAWTSNETRPSLSVSVPEAGFTTDGDGGWRGVYMRQVAATFSWCTLVFADADFSMSSASCWHTV